MRLLPLLLLALGVSSALAADNALVVTPGTGVTMRTIDDGGGHQIGTSVPVGVNGVSAWGTAGTANANILSVQGIASMTALQVANGGTFAVQAAQSGTWNITNISGTVSLPTGAATSALQPTNAAQGSTTSGQTGPLIQGAVTTSAPTYVTTQTAPLSLDTSGLLRVNVAAGGGSGGTSSSFSAAFPATGTAIGVKNGANMVNLAADASSNLLVGAASGALVDGSDATQGAKADAACGTDTGTCSLIALVKRNNQNAAGPLAAGTNLIGSVNLTAPTTGGCTGQTILSSATNIFTQVKASAGTLCWIRYQQTTTTLMDVRVYDTATNGNSVCASASNLMSNDVAQSNATSPGMVGNLGTYGQAHANGIGICITGANTNTDTTSAVTGLNLNIGFK